MAIMGVRPNQANEHHHDQANQHRPDQANQHHHARGMTLEDFKAWLKQFDVDGDGRISKGELREALRRRRGGWFTTIKAGRAVRRADRNNSGFVEDAEVENLVAFAQKDLGMKISAW